MHQIVDEVDVGPKTTLNFLHHGGMDKKLACSNADCGI